MDFSGLVKAWREYKHLTFMELSALSKISKASLFAWEKGGVQPSKKKIRQFAKNIGITEEEFYAGPDEQQVPAPTNSEYGAIPADLMPRLEQVARDTGVSVDILIRSVIGLFVELEATKQLSVLRAYLDVEGNRIEELLRERGVRYDPKIDDKFPV